MNFCQAVKSAMDIAMEKDSAAGERAHLTTSNIFAYCSEWGWKNSGVVMIRYIKNIDISFLILIYRIVLSKNIEFFDVSQYLLYIAIYSIYCNILCQNFIFLLLHYQNNENKRRK